MKILHSSRTEPYSEDPEHWRSVIHRVIFGTSTPAGRRFDLLLLVVIVSSVIAVMLESVAEIRYELGDFLITIEWVFTIVFAIEYVARLLSVRKPMRYALSFFGIVDLLAVLPTFIAYFIPGATSLMTIRILRMLRVFRIMKLVAFLREAQQLSEALRASRRKITVFLSTVLTLVVILGTLMYLIEGGGSGFTSIPRSIYWAIVTLTTVGYGDIAPSTAIGQAFAAFIMLLGYSIIAIPTGIVSSEIARVGFNREQKNKTCPSCDTEGQDKSAKYCKNCGEKFAA